MRSRIAVGMLCFLLTAGADPTHAGTSEKPVGEASKAGAQPAEKGFVSKAGRFSVAATGTPRFTKESVPTAAGPITMNTYMFQAGACVQGAIYADYPPAVLQKASKSAMLDGARDGAVRNVNGTLVNEREIAYLKHPGRELRIDIGNRLWLLGRIFLVGNRLYQVTVIGPKDQFPEEEAKKFLQSFALVK